MIEVLYSTASKQILIDGQLTDLNRPKPLIFQSWKFPVGEVGVKITPVDEPILKLFIKWDFESHDEFFVIANLLDAVYELNKGVRAHATLFMPYLPYSRQDRACHEGESFALYVFAKTITQMVDIVITTDVHNFEVANKVFTTENCTFVNIPQSRTARNLVGYDYFIAPDAGAAKKIVDHPEVKAGRTKVFTMKKKRVAGRVVHDALPPDVISGKVCVVDDLCDGGATFESVGRLLYISQPNIEQLDLFVTHGFFTKGIQDLTKFYDTIYSHKTYNQQAKSIVKELP